MAEQIGNQRECLSEPIAVNCNGSGGQSFGPDNGKLTEVISIHVRQFLHNASSGRGKTSGAIRGDAPFRFAVFVGLR